MNKDHSTQKKYLSCFLENLNAKYTVIDDKTIFIQRKYSLESEKIVNDVFGRTWVFMSGKIKTNQFSLGKENGEKINLPGGNYSAFFPVFCVVEWYLNPGFYDIEMIASLHEAPKHSPQHPIIFSQNIKGNIFQQLEHFVANGCGNEYININRSDNHCHLSLRTFEWLKNNYNKPISLSDLAKKFKTSASVLSRYFKKSYGMSPLEVLHKMRVMSSMSHLLLDKHYVLDVAMDVGYSQSRMYNEHFSQIIGNQPSTLLKLKVDDQI